MVVAVLRWGAPEGTGAPRCSCLERDVVFEDRLRRFRGGSRSAVASAASTFAASAHELDVIGDDLDLGALGAGVLVFPGTPPKLALDRDLRALGQEARERFSARAEDHDVDVV